VVPAGYAGTLRQKLVEKKFRYGGHNTNAMSSVRELSSPLKTQKNINNTNRNIN